MAIAELLLIIAVVLVVLGVATVGAGRFAWGRRTRRTEAAILGSARTPAGTGRPADTPLPDPVRRYLAWAAPGDRPSIRVARVRQTGQFLLNPPDDWAPFVASQLFTARPPAMLWDATIRMAPAVGVRVRDSYIRGVGSMRGAVLGLFTVLADSGTSAMAEASLMRYLAEAPWFPTRLRPSESLVWTPVDDRAAVATLRDGELTVSLEFRFDPGGPIHAVYAERRFRGEQEDPTWAPWIGRFSEYREVDGFRIPTRGAVAWVLDGEERPYWRGEIGSARYEYQAPSPLTTRRWP